jgi:hypothetical protein
MVEGKARRCVAVDALIGQGAALLVARDVTAFGTVAVGLALGAQHGETLGAEELLDADDLVALKGAVQRPRRLHCLDHRHPACGQGVSLPSQVAVQPFTSARVQEPGGE